MANIYWAARDLSSFWWGNHQFILIELGAGENLSQTQIQTEGNKRFVTLAGHQPDGNLVFVPNEPGDVKSVREYITPSSRGRWSDYDLEKHAITPVGASLTFARQIEALAYKYRANTKDKPVKYGLLNVNCSTWVNTLLKVAGISESARHKAGEFKGIDWGEEDLLDEALFK